MSIKLLKSISKCRQSTLGHQKYVNVDSDCLGSGILKCDSKMSSIGIEKQTLEEILDQKLKINLMCFFCGGGKGCFLFLALGFLKGWEVQESIKKTVLAKQRIEVQLVGYENRRRI